MDTCLKIPSFDSGFLTLMSGLKIFEDLVTVEEYTITSDLIIWSEKCTVP